MTEITLDREQEQTELRQLQEHRKIQVQLNQEVDLQEVYQILYLIQRITLVEVRGVLLKVGGSKTRTGSLIGSGDVVALKSAEDPGANNQFKFTASLTHANTNNTKVSGLLGNYTTEIRNLNLTLYKAWVIPKSQWTIIAANSSMLNFEKDFFNTTTTLASKRFKGDWKKLTCNDGFKLHYG